MSDSDKPADSDKLSPETPKDEKTGEPAANQGNVNTDTIFYYSREHRLSRASANVRSMNDGKPIRPSLSKTLFATGAHRLIFVAIVIAIVAFSLANRFSGRGNDGVNLGGNTLAAGITREEGILILEIVKTMPKSGEAYVGNVDLSVSPVVSQLKEGEKAPQIFSHRISFNSVETETYQVSLPFDGNDFLVIFKNDSGQKSVRLKVKS